MHYSSLNMTVMLQIKIQLLKYLYIHVWPNTEKHYSVQLRYRRFVLLLVTC